MYDLTRAIALHYDETNPEYHTAEPILSAASSSRRLYSAAYKFLSPTMDVGTNEVDYRPWELFLILGCIAPPDMTSHVLSQFESLKESEVVDECTSGFSANGFRELKKAIGASANGYKLLVPFFFIYFSIVSSGNLQSLTNDPYHYDKDCIAHIIQTLDACYEKWNTLASPHGHSNIEEMVRPYMTFNLEDFWYSVLPQNRYSTKSRWYSITTNYYVTSDIDEADYSLEERSSFEHYLVRKIAESFVNSIKNLAILAIDEPGSIELYDDIDFEIEHFENELSRTTVLTGAFASLDLPEDGLPIHTNIPSHILYSLHEHLNVQPDESVRLSTIPLHEWPTETLECLKSCGEILQSESMLRIDASEYGLYVMQSNISNAGRGVFSRNYIPSGTTVGCYSGTIIRSDITQRTNITDETKFGLQGLEVDFYRFRKYCWRYPIEGKPAYIVPDYFCVAAMVNDSRNSDYTVNVEVEWCDIDYDDLTSSKCLTYVAARDIFPGEELFIDYGPYFEF